MGALADLSRRGFLRVAGAAGAVLGAGVVLYRETTNLVLPTSNDWIEDRGDFLIVRVPDEKMFKGEKLLKPTILVMGMRSMVRDCEVYGYLNILGKGDWGFNENYVDCRKTAMTKDRPIILVQSAGRKTTINYNYLVGPDISPLRSEWPGLSPVLCSQRAQS